MSKGKGQKIAIKFDKPLLGEVAGNESAFTISGMQRNPLGVGELELKTYTPSTVERYPVATLYEDDFTGAMDGVEVGENGIKLVYLGLPNLWDGTSQVKYLSSGNWYDDPNTRTTNLIPLKPNTQYTIIGCNRLRCRWENALGALVGYSDQPNPANTSTPVTVTTPTNTAQGYFYYSNIGDIDIIINEGGVIEEGGGYFLIGTYMLSIDATELPTNPRLKWTEDLPTGTSITAEYAVNQDELTAPTTWTPVNNNDLLTIPDPATGYFLWLRYTLATTDTAVTPTLLSVWLEEAEAPPDTILLSFDTHNRFNDVEGDITVAYNQSLGTLAGTRPVESFSVDFTPADLEPTPIDEHTITAGIDLTVDLIDLEFTEIYADHNVTHTATAGIDVTVALINIEDINP